MELILKVDPFLLQLTVVAQFLEELMKGYDLGAMWEAMLMEEAV